MSRTLRVKKYLANTKKRAAKGTPDEVTTKADDNPMLVEDGGDVKVSESADKVTKRLPPRKPLIGLTEVRRSLHLVVGRNLWTKAFSLGKQERRFQPHYP